MSPVENGFNVLPCLLPDGLYWSRYEAVGDVDTVFFGDESPVLSNALDKFEIGWGDAIADFCCCLCCLLSLDDVLCRLPFLLLWFAALLSSNPRYTISDRDANETAEVRLK